MLIGIFYKIGYHYLFFQIYELKFPCHDRQCLNKKEILMNSIINFIKTLPEKDSHFHLPNKVVIFSEFLKNEEIFLLPQKDSIKIKFFNGRFFFLFISSSLRGTGTAPLLIGLNIMQKLSWQPPGKAAGKHLHSHVWSHFNVMMKWGEQCTLF